MRIEKHKIEIKGVSHYTLPFLLTQKTENLGLYTPFNDKEGEKVTVEVKGVTTEKLEKVRSFDINQPYIVGVNGVISIVGSIVKYSIDGIIYETNLTNLATTFQFTTERVESEAAFILEAQNEGIVERLLVEGEIDIVRQKVSVIEAVSKLQQISDPDMIKSFNNGYYKVYGV